MEKKSRITVQYASKRKKEAQCNIPHLPSTKRTVSFEENICQKNEKRIKTGSVLDFFKKEQLWNPDDKEDVPPLLNVDVTSNVESFQKENEIIVNFTDNSKQGPLVSPKVDSLKKKKYQQLQLALGQRFGPIVCKECEMSYRASNEGDVDLHRKYHRQVLEGIDYKGFQKQRIIASFQPSEGFIVCVSSNSSKQEMAKALEILNIVNSHLGGVSIPQERLQKSQYYLYISSKKKAIGFVLAESIHGAARKDILVEKDSLEKTGNRNGVLCGINRVWVSPQHRNKGIGKRMLEAVRTSFIYNLEMIPSQMAFSQPTELGHKLAVSFFQTKNYIVYNEDNLDEIS